MLLLLAHCNSSLYGNQFDTGLSMKDVDSVSDSASNAGDLGLIPGSGRSPGVGNGNPLQCSCLENSIVREVWQPTVQSHKESDITNTLTFHLFP